jgi:hypothetical protein
VSESANRVVIAAKAHQCESCDRAIAKGHGCLRTIEGRFTTWRHLCCAAALVNARGELVHDCADLRTYIAGRQTTAPATEVSL